MRVYWVPYYCRSCRNCPKTCWRRSFIVIYSTPYLLGEFFLFVIIRWILIYKLKLYKKYARSYIARQKTGKRTDANRRGCVKLRPARFYKLPAGTVEIADAAGEKCVVKFAVIIYRPRLRLCARKCEEINVTLERFLLIKSLTFNMVLHRCIYQIIKKWCTKVNSTYLV